MTEEPEVQAAADTEGAPMQANDFPTVEVVDQAGVPHHPGADPDGSDPTRVELEPAAGE